MVNMQNKILIVVGITILFLGVGIQPAMANDNPIKPISNGKTLYVGGSSEGNYTKIQDAIDNASSGDTVFVYNGSYFENVIVNKSINLIGKDRNTTFIDANYSGDVVYVSAKRTNISGFTIKNSGNREAPYCDAGIDIDASNCCVYDSKILENEYGIYFNGFFGSSNKNTIMGNIISKNEYGTWGYKSQNNTITRNNIFQNGVGIFHITGNNNIIQNNISNNYGGIKAQSTNNYITDNIISSNNCYGISITSDKNTINNNTISGNEYGIYLTYIFFLPNIFSPSTKNIIYGNTISDNSYGIYLEYSLLNLILKNNFINNEEDAFFTRSFFNRWKQNYWNGSRVFPKLIFGYIGYFRYQWINIDWRPAKEPYDIDV
jgi:parallel beta-helix repeat protein